MTEEFEIDDDKRPIDCDAQMRLSTVWLTCDRSGGHTGQHGGVYSGFVGRLTVDVQVGWSE